MSIETIRPGIAVSPLKQQFLDYVAKSYDDWVEMYEIEPEGLIFGFGDFDGNASSQWIIPNEEMTNRNRMLLASINYEINVTMLNA